MSLFGKISSTEGKNKTSAPADSKAALSADSFLGYRSKSAGELNCSGFTKIEATTKPDCFLAISISDRWPAWIAPMVGTKEIFLPLCLTRAISSRSSDTVRIVFIY